jgi:hypothetical protein
MKYPWPFSLYMDRIMRKNFESGYKKLRREWDARVRLLTDTNVYHDDAN